MKKVIVESPYAGNIDLNISYAKDCVKDCLVKGEAPIVSHLLYTQPGILNDANPVERAIGISAGLAWSPVCDYVVVYTDLGVTKGMQAGIEEHKKQGTPIVYRSLEKYQKKTVD